MFKNYILPFANMVTLGRGGGGESPPGRFPPFFPKKPLHANLWLFLNFSCGGPHEKKSNILFYPPPLRGIFGHPVHPNFVFLHFTQKIFKRSPNEILWENVLFGCGCPCEQNFPENVSPPWGHIYTPPPRGGGGVNEGENLPGKWHIVSGCN